MIFPTQTGNQQEDPVSESHRRQLVLVLTLSFFTFRSCPSPLVPRLFRGSVFVQWHVSLVENKNRSSEEDSCFDQSRKTPCLRGLDQVRLTDPDLRDSVPNRVPTHTLGYVRLVTVRTTKGPRYLFLLCTGRPEQLDHSFEPRPYR